MGWRYKSFVIRFYSFREVMNIGSVAMAADGFVTDVADSFDKSVIVACRLVERFAAAFSACTVKHDVLAPFIIN